jgi:hypothetical protein
MRKTTRTTNIGPALHAMPQHIADEEIFRRVKEAADEILDRYVSGESMQQISDSLKLGIPGYRLRRIFDSTVNGGMETAHESRSHHLIEMALDYGKQAAAIGDSAGLKTAIDVNMKVAAKLNPTVYGDRSKVELTGKDGGALEIKADLSLTAEQAYERLIKGS